MKRTIKKGASRGGKSAGRGGKSGGRSARGPRRPSEPGGPATRGKSGSEASSRDRSVQENLREYRRKRRFDRTPEPEGEAPEREHRKPARENAAERGKSSRGKTAPERKAPAHRRAGAAERGERRYFVQMHFATRLHYDLRLELDGVLKSWAVPKGPSCDPEIKRLAVQVEDHPLEYGEFEGMIPAGEYGAGPVLLWDRGVWIPKGDPRAGYTKGHLDFRLVGEKLRGEWNLVRMRAGRDDVHDNWLLIKKRDQEARPESSHPVTEERPESVSTGRRIEEIGERPRKRARRPAPAREPAPTERPVAGRGGEVRVRGRNGSGRGLRRPVSRGIRKDGTAEDPRSERRPGRRGVRPASSAPPSAT